MKKVIIIILIIFIPLVQLIAQGSQEKKQENWKWFTLDEFEGCFNWRIVNSTFSQSDWKFDHPRLSRVKGAPKELTSENDQYCLGAKFTMENTGDTRRFIIPQHKIVLPGRCKKISFWVNGRGKAIVMSVMFMDENNILHTFRTVPALMDFYGWKKVEIDNLDRKIDQYSVESKYKKPIKIICIILENPMEYWFEKPIYIYLDKLEAYCLDEDPGTYDGSEIPDTW